MLTLHYIKRKYYTECTEKFPVWLRNRLISAGLEPVLSHTEKSFIISYYIQFSTNIKMYNHNIKNSFVSPFL